MTPFAGKDFRNLAPDLRNMWKWCLSFCLALNSLQLPAQSFQLEEFSSGYTNPLDIAHCGDGRLFIVQKNGYIYICDSAGNKNATPFLDIQSRVKTTSERGLLGLAFHPDYFSNGYFFIFYSPKGTDSNIVARFNVDPDNPDLADTSSEQTVISIAHPFYDNHDGGCIKFGRDGYLYIGTGDGGSSNDPDNNGQNRKSSSGKILRIDVSADSGYTVPPDNPFVNDDTFSPEIWSLGWRNPWRFSFDRLNQDLWIGDVGQGIWEEVDLIEAPDTGGQNFGWDCYEGFAANETQHCDSAGDLTWPIHVYQHTGGDCSVTGGFVYRGAQFKNFYGKYIFTDYCSGKFRMIERENGNWVATQVLDGANYTFSGFGEDRYGELYVAGYSGSDGKIYRVTDSLCSPVAQILIDKGNGSLSIDSAVCSPFALQTPFGAGLTYQWYANGIEIPGATSNIFQPLSSDSTVYTVVVTNLQGCSTASSPVLDATSVGAALIIGLEPEYCIYQSADTLTGDPAGGTFMIDGVPGNIFDPAAAGSGTHTITYTYTNSYACEVTTTLETTVDLCTGLTPIDHQGGVTLFPNPASGIVTIRLKNMRSEGAHLSVCNFAGATVMSTSLPAGVEQNQSMALDLSWLPDGFYTIWLNHRDRQWQMKLVIQH